MAGEEELRVPPAADPEKVEQGQIALHAMRGKVALAVSVLNLIGSTSVAPEFREVHAIAVNSLAKTIETLAGGLEIVLGKREPSAAERAGQK